MEKIIEQPKRYGTMKKGCEYYGVSYATLNHMCNTGQVNFITTESGLRRVELSDSGSIDTAAIMARLDVQDQILKELAGRFGIPTPKAAVRL